MARDHNFSSILVGELKDNLNIAFKNIDSAMTSLNKTLRALTSTQKWDTSTSSVFSKKIASLCVDYEMIKEQMQNMDEYLAYIHHYYKKTEANEEELIVNFSEELRKLNERI